MAKGLALPEVQTFLGSILNTHLLSVALGFCVSRRPWSWALVKFLSNSLIPHLNSAPQTTLHDYGSRHYWVLVSKSESKRIVFPPEPSLPWPFLLLRQGSPAWPRHPAFAVGAPPLIRSQALRVLIPMFLAYTTSASLRRVWLFIAKEAWLVPVLFHTDCNLYHSHLLAQSTWAPCSRRHHSWPV